MVCSFGALKLCERHPVNGYTFCLASYYAIGTYSVIGSDRSSVASRALGTSPEFAEINSEIVYLGDHLGRSGYCPSRLSADLSPPYGMSLSGGWVGHANGVPVRASARYPALPLPCLADCRDPKVPRRLRDTPHCFCRALPTVATRGSRAVCGLPPPQRRVLGRHRGARRALRWPCVCRLPRPAGSAPSA